MQQRRGCRNDDALFNVEWINMRKEQTNLLALSPFELLAAEGMVLLAVVRGPEFCRRECAVPIIWMFGAK